MAHEKSDVDFIEELRHQDRIKGRLISGQRFSGKVYSCGVDYIQIVELSIENTAGDLEREDQDIVRMRADSIMCFDKG
ncbi:MAG: hypothetical protein K2X47_10895 [Bdellovibrionales bacterium]|nr:hypothetical protein [Bdellovibrionales bacterium]